MGSAVISTQLRGLNSTHFSTHPASVKSGLKKSLPLKGGFFNLHFSSPTFPLDPAKPQPVGRGA